MRAWQLTWTEIRRITSTRMGRLTVVALALVPTLYAGLYLYANHDPYAALDRVPAALVMADQGVSDADGAATNSGRDVADELLRSGDFGWHEVDRAEAADGVEHGRYDFALIIPQSFSASLASVGGSDPEQARLTLVTNDANSYLSTTIANTVVGKVSEAVTRKVGHEAALTFLTGIADTRQGLLRGAEGATELKKGIGTARAGAQDLTDGAEQVHEGASALATGADALVTGLDTLKSGTASLPRDARALADGAAKVAKADAQIADKADAARDLVTTLRTSYERRRGELRQQLQGQGLTPVQIKDVLAVYDQVGVPVRRADAKAAALAGQLDTLRTGSQQVADGAAALATAAPQLKDGITAAHSGAVRLADGAGTLEVGTQRVVEGATALDDGLGEVKAGAATLRSGLREGAAQIPTTDKAAREQMAQTISNPVTVRNSSSASAGSYGEGLAPFFLALAAWIGGYVLFLAVRPLSRRALAANQKPWRIALGGWAAPALIGAVQMVLAVGVVTLTVGVLPQHVLAVLGVLVLSSVTFIAVIHFLCSWLGSPGQFLGLILMVVQLVSAGGTFPWQTIPTPLHPLHQMLPMPHAVDAVRLALYGGPSSLLLTHVAVLLAWLVGALALTTLVAHRQRIWSPRRINPEFQM